MRASWWYPTALSSSSAISRATMTLAAVKPALVDSLFAPPFTFTPCLLPSIEHERLLPVGRLDVGWLVLLQEDEVFEHQHVHLRPHEAPPAVLRRADDRLAA